jgi:hypothetical protein
MHLDQAICAREGVLHKTDHLDGCTWIITTKDGKRLLPQNAHNFEFRDLQEIKFSYTSFEGMSICMAEDEIITLTCVQTLPSATCQDILAWDQLNWLKDEVENRDPVSVYRFVDSSNFLFKVIYSDKRYTWYDCLGRVICQSAEGCALAEKDVAQKTPIFIAHR